MRRYDCLKLLVPKVSADTLVVCNLQDTTYEWQHLRPSDGNLLRQGLANVTPVALGLALALPHRRVISLDGDGSVLLGLGILSTLGRYAAPNLMVIVFDNENYNSGGVMPSATAYGTDLAMMAQGGGVKSAQTVRDLAAFDRATSEVLASNELGFIVAKVDRTPEPVPRPRIDGKENKYRFVRFVEALEGKPIFLADEQKSFS